MDKIKIVGIVSLLLIVGTVAYDKLLPPRGERLVFSYRGRVCIAATSGWHKRCLVAGENPAWSPDGRRIAFEVHTLPGETDDPRHRSSIYIVNADGSDLTRLTDANGHDESPAWSPGGESILFRSNRDEHWNFYLVSTSSGELKQLTINESSYYAPAWSPDGQQIAFMIRTEPERTLDIYIMNADGSHVKRLTDHPSDDVRPSWSPDGQKIAFESKRDGNWEIYVMEVDGSNQTRLTDHPAVDRGPVWSPDGTRIAFLSGRSGRTSRLLYEGITIQLQDIYVMNADGTHVKRLTYSLFGTYQDLDWSHR